MQSNLDQVERYAEELRREGVVSIEGYLDPNRCDDIREQIDDLLTNDDLDIAEPGMGYNEKTDWDGALLDKRDGTRDDGMRDIFNVDCAIDELQSIKNDEFINKMINGAANEVYTTDNINAYINKSVTSTRGYHADTYGGKFKSFIYLTEVEDESYGPFSYVKGTHDKSTVERYGSALINKVRGNHVTDAVWYDDEKAVTFTAPKGTLVVANQAGFHRGIPQEEGRERMLVTTSYTIDK